MVKELLIVITFLTRIPLKIKFPFHEEELGRTSRYFPLVGLLIGILVAAVAKLFGLIDVSIGAVMGILTAIVLTGGLHLDGLMDTADGIFSARSRERMLEIMKDSRIGAHGVTAAIILLLLKFVLYQAVLESQETWRILPVAFMLSRWVMVYAILFFPGARKEGLGNIFTRYRRRSDFPVASLLTLLPLIIFRLWLFLVPVAATICLIWLCCRSIRSMLGGLTGDIYGAMAELSEGAFILFYFAFAKMFYLL